MAYRPIFDDPSSLVVRISSSPCSLEVEWHDRNGRVHPLQIVLYSDADNRELDVFLDGKRVWRIDKDDDPPAK